MPRPVGQSSAYMPGLDGLRALSVVAVVGYHLGVPYLQGGFLGVGMFFTLSGYLITSILLRNWRKKGRVDVRDFWIRRARRLLPGVVLLLAVVLVATAIAQPDNLAKRVTESIAAILYVSNWATIRSGISYFERFGGPGPLDHLWSLAIEEQFYVLWPLLFGLVMKLFRGRLRWVLILTIALAAASFAAMYLVAVPGLDNTRAYEGTDTRAGGILVGAALAMAWTPGRHASRTTLLNRTLMDGLGLGALSLIGILVVTTDQYSLSLYRGGLLALSLATAVLVSVVAHPTSLVGKAIGLAPLRWIGERSYGIYLWHLPLVAFIPKSFMADQVVLRGVVLVGLTLLIAELSWTLIEDPIRVHGFVGAMRLRRAGQLDAEPRSAPELASVVAWCFVTVFGIAVLSSAALVGRSADALAAGPRPLTLSATTLPPQPVAALSTPVVATTTPVPAVPMTSCKAVAHVGDSTSIGLMSEEYLPDPALRIDAQYRNVGAATVLTDIAGARSVVETYEGQPNAETAVLELQKAGHDGCWVFAMGTNEAANYAAGSNVGGRERIDILMAAAGPRPVMWLTVRSLRGDGPYADGEMRKFNEALAESCRRYPNMAVYDWASEVPDGWFQDDGIHFTSEGYAERGRRTALALASAFPSVGTPANRCDIASQ